MVLNLPKLLEPPLDASPCSFVKIVRKKGNRMFDPEPGSKHALATSRSLFPCCSAFQTRKVRKSHVVSSDRESGTTPVSRPRIVRRSPRFPVFLPCRRNLDCTLNRLSRPETLPDSKLSRRKRGYVSSISRRKSGRRETSVSRNRAISALISK